MAIGLLYDNIGEKGSMVQQNISLLFLVLLFLVSLLFQFPLYNNKFKALFRPDANCADLPNRDERICS